VFGVLNFLIFLDAEILEKCRKWITKL